MQISSATFPRLDRDAPFAHGDQPIDKPTANRPDDQAPRGICHGCPAGTDHDREVPENDLLSPLTLRRITLRNRIAMSPMCQHVAAEGLASGWHLVHLGSRAVGGAPLGMGRAPAAAPGLPTTHPANGSHA